MSRAERALVALLDAMNALLAHVPASAEVNQAREALTDARRALLGEKRS